MYLRGMYHVLARSGCYNKQKQKQKTRGWGGFIHFGNLFLPGQDLGASGVWQGPSFWFADDAF
jgi:hypothetical protein